MVWPYSGQMLALVARFLRGESDVFLDLSLQAFAGRGVRLGEQGAVAVVDLGSLEQSAGKRLGGAPGNRLAFRAVEVGDVELADDPPRLLHGQLHGCVLGTFLCDEPCRRAGGDGEQGAHQGDQDGCLASV